MRYFKGFLKGLWDWFIYPVCLWPFYACYYLRAR